MTTMTAYRDAQVKKPWWIWGVLAIGGGLPVAAIGGALVMQIVTGHPVGNKPLPTPALAAATAMTVLISGAVAYILVRWRLDTEVGPRELVVALRPFATLHIDYADIASAEARTYRPLVEYGGWGLRGLGSDRALTVSGNRGVQLVMKNGDRLLIGSDDADALAAAIQAARR